MRAHHLAHQLRQVGDIHSNPRRQVSAILAPLAAGKNWPIVRANRCYHIALQAAHSFAVLE
jgi:hypothetical protein